MEQTILTAVARYFKPLSPYVDKNNRHKRYAKFKKSW